VSLALKTCWGAQRGQKFGEKWFLAQVLSIFGAGTEAADSSVVLLLFLS
jgi:hypothetical protein